MEVPFAALTQRIPIPAARARPPQLWVTRPGPAASLAMTFLPAALPWGSSSFLRDLADLLSGEAIAGAGAGRSPPVPFAPRRAGPGPGPHRGSPAGNRGRRCCPAGEAAAAHWPPGNLEKPALQGKEGEGEGKKGERKGWKKGETVGDTERSPRWLRDCPGSWVPSHPLRDSTSSQGFSLPPVR